MVIRRIAPLSLGKIQGILLGLVGLLIGAFMSLFSLLGAAAGGEGSALAIVFGVGAIVILPLLYAIIGFLGGAVGALLFNLAASLVGGLEVDAE